jgi:hypothetical protein
MGQVHVLAGSVRNASIEGEQELPEAVASIRSPRARMPDGLNAARTVEQVAGVLRFPAALLGVILLFMAFQQRADRHDPKLTHAPVGSRQEMLEFR